MSQQPQLIDVTELGQEVVLAFDYSEPGIGNWFDPVDLALDSNIPLYFTWLLWERLGGAQPDLQRYHDRARSVLRAAQETLAQRIIGQNAWRSWLIAKWDAEPHHLWLIVNHSYPDGIAIGLGPIDFW